MPLPSHRTSTRSSLENDRVRVLESSAKTGDKTEMHGHPALVAVAITDSTYRFTSPGTEPVEIERGAGQAMFMDVVEHETQFLGPGEGQVILVELK